MEMKRIGWTLTVMVVEDITSQVVHNALTPGSEDITI